MKEPSDLRQKLELLGEVALPESLTAEELFRRMDRGELVLPPEKTPAAEPAPSPKVIPWVKVLRRGVPIAACFALVVFIAQGGLHWRMGSSGGANLTGSAAPQKEAAMDQTAPAEADKNAPLDEYRSNAGEEAEAPDDSAPQVIAMEDRAEDADEEAAAGLARQDGIAMGPQKSAGADGDDHADSSNASVNSPSGAPSAPDGRPDTGGGSDDQDDSDPDNSNPDTGGGGYKDDIIWGLLSGIAMDLREKDERLAGLTPYVSYYEPIYDDGIITSVIGYVTYLDVPEGEDVRIRIHCLVHWLGEGKECELKYISHDEWVPVKDQGKTDPADPDYGDGEPNPDTSGSDPWPGITEETPPETAGSGGPAEEDAPAPGEVPEDAGAGDRETPEDPEALEDPETGAGEELSPDEPEGE